MRRIVVSEFLTLDGVMEAPGRETSLGKRGGWVLKFSDEELRKHRRDQLFASDALLLGRVTYQIFAAAWPTMTDQTGFAARMNSIPKYVVSSTLNALEWNNSRLINGNIREEVSKLKQQPGKDILAVGSGELVATLMQHDLIDELCLTLVPVVLGKGKRLFQGASDLKFLKLRDMNTLSSGIAILTYQTSGNDVKK